jgi:hypothetical protein
MSLGGQLSVIRPVPRMAGSEDLGAIRVGFLFWFTDAVAEKSLSSDCFPLSGQHRLGSDHRSRAEVKNLMISPLCGGSQIP